MSFKRHAPAKLTVGGEKKFPAHEGNITSFLVKFVSIQRIYIEGEKKFTLSQLSMDMIYSTSSHVIWAVSYMTHGCYVAHHSLSLFF